MSPLLEMFPQLTLVNLLVAAGLGLGARLLQTRSRLAWFAHLLWVLMLLKLLTPPVFDLAILPDADAAPVPEATPLTSEAFGEGALDPSAALTTEGISAPEPLSSAPAVEDATSPLIAPAWWLAIWAAGSLFVFLRSLRDLLRFDRLLERSLVRADDDLVRRTATLAERFGLRRPPRLALVRARLAPLVWPFGRRPLVVIPEDLHARLDDSEMEHVLAHELAHIARRDHWTRWLEWAATVLFWWNPLTWWARHHLRHTEEQCCDALVLERLRPEPRAYGHTLVTTIEHLSRGDLHPPALAARLDSGGSLEERLKMLLSPRRPRAPLPLVKGGVFLAALLILPLGLVQAQEEDPRYLTGEQRVLKAVARGELSAEDAAKKLAELRERHLKPKSAKQKRNARILRFRLGEGRIKAAVDRGDLSEADAKKKIQALRREVFGEQAKEYRTGELRSRYVDQVERYERLRSKGVLSELEAQQKLRAYKLREAAAEWERYLAAQNEMRAREEAYMDQSLRAQNAEIKKWLAEAVKRGEFSEEEAERKLRQHREQSRRDEDGRRRDELKKRFAEAMFYFESEVKNGRMSKTEAEKKLAEVKEKNFGAKKSRSAKSDFYLKRDELRDVEAQIKAAVKAGSLTPEEGEAKLLEIRRGALKKDEKKERATHGHAAMVEKYEEYERTLERLTKEGKLAEDEAKKKLEELKRKMFRDAEKRKTDRKKLEKKKSPRDFDGFKLKSKPNSKRIGGIDSSKAGGKPTESEPVPNELRTFGASANGVFGGC